MLNPDKYRYLEGIFSNINVPYSKLRVFRTGRQVFVAHKYPSTEIVTEFDFDFDAVDNFINMKQLEERVDYVIKDWSTYYKYSVDQAMDGIIFYINKLKENHK